MTWDDLDAIWLYVTTLRERELGRYAIRRGDPGGSFYDINEQWGGTDGDVAGENEWE
jgi:hypothetical protein